MTEANRSGAGQPAPSRTAHRSGAGQPAPWIVLAEQLAAVEIAGGAVVLTAVAWVQSKRPDLEARAPAERHRGQIFSALRAAGVVARRREGA